MKIRHARVSDLFCLAEIKNYYIKNTNALWQCKSMTEGEVLSWFLEHGRLRHPIIVAESENGDIMGYASLSQYRTLPGYRFAGELSIYVKPEYHNKKIGTRLMESIIASARHGCMRCIMSFIDGENLNSITFHERFGFQHCGKVVGVGEKWGVTRDLIVMNLQLKK